MISSSSIFAKKVYLSIIGLLSAVIFMLICPGRVFAEEGGPGSSIDDPIIGEEDRVITGEDGTTRYVGPDGYEVENVWVTAGENTYYFDNTGRALMNCLRRFDEKTYCFDESGVCRFGLVTFEGKTYFITPALGLNIGWVSAEGDQDIYYFDEEGVMQTGWASIDGKDYYFDEDGRMHTGWLTAEDEEHQGTYYFDETGYKAEGWKQIEAEWYCFPEYSDYTLITDTWINGKDGYRVYVTHDGSMITNETREIGGMKYSFGENGESRFLWWTAFTINWPYILIFVLSTFLVFFASTSKGKIPSLVFAIGAVLSVSVIAALRNISVGDDVTMYITRQYEYYFSDAPMTVFKYLRTWRQMEPLFNLLMYTTARLKLRVYTAMGVLALITNGFVYAGIRKRNASFERSVIWFSYCFLFYNATLNLMRQYVAVAILFYLFSEPGKLRFRKVFSYTILAVGFHFSGIIGLLLWLLRMLFVSPRIPVPVKILSAVPVIFFPIYGPVSIGRVIEKLNETHPEQFSKYRVFIYGNRQNQTFSVSRSMIIVTLIASLPLIVFLVRILIQRRAEKLLLRQYSDFPTDPENQDSAYLDRSAEDDYYPEDESDDMFFEIITDDSDYWLEAWDDDEYIQKSPNEPAYALQSVNEIKGRDAESEKASAIPVTAIVYALTDLTFSMLVNGINGRFQCYASIGKLEYPFVLFRDDPAVGKCKGIKIFSIIWHIVWSITVIWYWWFRFVYNCTGGTSPYLFWFE